MVDRRWVHAKPDKLRELVNIWFSEAGANGAFPLDDRSAVEILTTPGPLAGRWLEGGRDGTSDLARST